MTGKCPHCKTLLLRVELEDMAVASGPGKTTWNGISYVCPSCRTILGVSIDPVALKTELADEILRALDRR
jgi:hypothetical protein